MATDNRSEIKGEHVTVHVTREPGCRLKLEVEVSPTAAAASYSKAVKSISKEISLPGFRKGKAPENKIVSLYGKHVEQEWRELVMRMAFNEALDLVKQYPLNNNNRDLQAQVKSLSKEEGGKFIFSYESHPDIPEINPAEIHLKQEKKQEVSSAAVEEALANLRLYHAKWDKITDRPIQEGDYVELTIDAISEPIHNICKSARFEVTKEKMAPWLHKIILGLNTGDQTEGTSELDPNADQPENYSPPLCRIVVNAIYQPVLPDVDDALAQKAGVQTVDELNGRIAEHIEKQLNNSHKEALWIQLESILVNKFDFDVPGTLFASEKKTRIEGLKQEKKISNDPLSQDAEDKINREVKDSLRLFFIVRKIADQKHIQVEEQEVLMELLRRGYRLPEQSKMSQKDQADVEELKWRIHFLLLLEKVKDYLLKQVTIE